MSTKLIRQAVVTEVERARLAWNAVGGNNPLIVSYENQGQVDLAIQTDPYLMVDVVFLGGEQLDMNARPFQEFDGQVILSAGAKEGTGTLTQSDVLDFVYPYLQLRDNLLNGVRTAVAVPMAPKRANGFYYVNMSIYFWRCVPAPATP